MLVELYIFYEIVLIAFFLISFFTKHEIIWALTVVLAGFLMFSSYNIEVSTFEYNASITAYQPIVITNSYPYLLAVNIAFFGLGLLLMLFDIFDKYGSKFSEGIKNPPLPKGKV